jgi:hypothetical protein
MYLWIAITLLATNSCVCVCDSVCVCVCVYMSVSVYELLCSQRRSIHHYTIVAYTSIYNSTYHVVVGNKQLCVCVYELLSEFPVSVNPPLQHTECVYNYAYHVGVAISLSSHTKLHEILPSTHFPPYNVHTHTLYTLYTCTCAYVRWCIRVGIQLPGQLHTRCLLPNRVLP